MVLQVRYGQDKPAAGLQYAEYLPGDPQGIGGMLDDMPAGHNVEGIGGKASIPEFPLPPCEPMAGCVPAPKGREPCALDVPPLALRPLGKHARPAPPIQEPARRPP